MSKTKWTNFDITEMHRRRSEGWTQGQIARHFKISIAHVGRVLRGEARITQDLPPAQDFDTFSKEMDELLPGLMDIQPKRDE